MQLDSQPETLAKALPEPVTLRHVGLTLGYPKREETVQRLREILVEQRILALGSAPACAGNQAAQCLVSGQILRQQHHLGSRFDLHFTADDQLNPGFLRCLPGPHDTGHGAFIGNGQRPVTMAGSPLEQLRCAGGAALKGEIGQTMQLGILHQANQPCSQNGPDSPTGRNTHANWP